MKNYLKPISLLCLLVLLLSSCGFAQESKNKLPVPDFQLQDLVGETVSLSDYKGKQPVLLFFWTTWCPFCRKELKVLNEKHASLTRDGLEVLAIDIGEPWEKVDNFVKSFGLNFLVLLDKDTNTAEAYDIVGVPTFVLVDKKGNIVFKDNFFPARYKDLLPK
ncbi:MAG: TlpA disulfide reductase family protein [Candidatus Omnitrophota bacterium]